VDDTVNRELHVHDYYGHTTQQVAHMHSYNGVMDAAPDVEGHT